MNEPDFDKFLRNEQLPSSGDPQITSSQDEVAANEVGRLRRAAEGAILFAEITPINEALRVAAGGAAIAAGADPLLVAGAFGGANLVIESAAAYAAASWLGTEKSKKTIDWFNDKIQKIGIAPEAKFGIVAKSAIAYLGGSAIATAVKFREEPTMTERELRRYGLMNSGILSGVVAVQGYFVAQGIESPNPLTVGLAAASVGSIGAIYKWAKRKVRREEARSLRGLPDGVLES